MYRPTHAPARLQCYHVDLPGHRFPMERYRAVHELLGGLTGGGAASNFPVAFATPRPATREELLAAHTPAYVDGYLEGTLPPEAHRDIGFPWSKAFVARTLAITGGTLDATAAALAQFRAPSVRPTSREAGTDGATPAGGASGGSSSGVVRWTGPGGIACNQAGGTHHAFAHRGEGFCIFNDLAVAARCALQAAAAAAPAAAGTSAAATAAGAGSSGSGGGGSSGGNRFTPLSHLFRGIRRILVLDLDVHQGNGTAQIFGTASASADGGGDGSGVGQQQHPLQQQAGGGGYGRGTAAAAAAAAAAASKSSGGALPTLPPVVTVSLHGAGNYPWSTRYPSTLDVDVPDGCGDAGYLDLLRQALARVDVMTGRPPVGVPAYATPRAPTQLVVGVDDESGGADGGTGTGTGIDLVLYQAGVDPLQHDRLGRLKLTRTGLRERNELVFRWCEARRLPVVVTMGGGYSRPIHASARAHADVFLQAAQSWARRRAAFEEEQQRTAAAAAGMR